MLSVADVCLLVVILLLVKLIYLVTKGQNEQIRALQAIHEELQRKS